MSGRDSGEEGPPRQLRLPVPIVQVACEASHLVALRSDALVCTWGRGSFGALGHGDRADCAAPRIVEALRGLRCRHVAAGRNHVLALAAPGGSERSLVLGWGACGTDALDGASDAPIVVQPLTSAHVHTIACGWDLCAAAGEAGGVAVWTGSWRAPFWAETRRLLGVRVLPGGVSCGYRHAAVRTDRGALYVVRLRPEGGGFDAPASVAELDGRCSGRAAGGALTAVAVRERGGAEGEGIGGAALALIIHPAASVDGRPLVVPIDELLNANKRRRARAAGGGPCCLLALTAGGAPCADLKVCARRWLAEGHAPAEGSWAAWGATGAASDEPALGAEGARLLELLHDGPPLLGLSIGGTGRPATRGGGTGWNDGPICAALVPLEEEDGVPPGRWRGQSPPLSRAALPRVRASPRAAGGHSSPAPPRQSGAARAAQLVPEWLPRTRSPADYLPRSSPVSPTLSSVAAWDPAPLRMPRGLRFSERPSPELVLTSLCAHRAGSHAARSAENGWDSGGYEHARAHRESLGSPEPAPQPVACSMVPAASVPHSAPPAQAPHRPLLAAMARSAAEHAEWGRDAHVEAERRSRDLWRVRRAAGCAALRAWRARARRQRLERARVEQLRGARSAAAAAHAVRRLQTHAALRARARAQVAPRAALRSGLRPVSAYAKVLRALSVWTGEWGVREALRAWRRAAARDGRVELWTAAARRCGCETGAAPSSRAMRESVDIVSRT